jgi:hypothetical protein
MVIEGPEMRTDAYIAAEAPVILQGSLDLIRCVVNLPPRVITQPTSTKTLIVINLFCMVVTSHSMCLPQQTGMFYETQPGSLQH